MKKTLSRLLLSLACALSPRPLLAQAADEPSVYAAWYAASQGGDAASALAAAKDYLAKFPDGANAGYVKKWMASQQWKGFNEAVQKKDMNAMIAAGRENLAADASFAYWMAWYLRQNELLSAGDPAHAKEAEEFSKAAIEFVERGGVATGIDAAKWNKDANLAWLHQNLALLAAKDGRAEEAFRHYETSSKLAPGDAALNARNHLGCGSLNKSLYDDAVAKFKALPDAEKGGPSAQAAIETANKHADAAIQCWARFLGTGTGSPDLRSKIEAAIGALWAYRHPDQPEGWKALVQKGA